MSEFFKTNTTRIAQLCCKDSATDNWIPITVTQMPDGGYAVRVDSEPTLQDIKTNTAQILQKQVPNIYAEGYTRKLIDGTHDTIPFRGAMFEVDADIHAPMESMIVADTLVKTLTYGSGDTGVCQIFQASEDNLHDVRFIFKGSGAATTIDAMEYASDGAAQAAWIVSDATNTQVYSEAAIKMQGSYSLKVHCSKNNSPGDTVTKTTTSTSFINQSIRFRRYNTIGNSRCIWKIRISDDGTDWYEASFTSINANTWEEINIDVSTMTLVGTSVNLAAITKVQFYMVECVNNDHYWYCDQLELIGAAGIAAFRLYSFGTTQNPTNLSEGTQMTFDEGENEIAIDPPINKTLVNVHAHLGAHARTTKLTKGNYYGLWIGGLTSGTLDLYGSSTQLYVSGKMFTENAGALASTTKSLRFLCFSITDAVLSDFKITFDASPGDSDMFIPVKNYENNQLMTNFLGTVHFNSRTSLTLDFDCIADVPVYVTADTPFRPIFVDNLATSLATELLIETCYAYKPIETYN